MPKSLWPPGALLTHVVLLLLATALFSLLAAGSLSLADDAIQIVDNHYRVQFGESVSFHLEARAAAGVSEVILYYRRSGENVTVRVPIPHTPDQTVFDHTWELEPGEIAVGARLEYEWRITDATGDVVQTPTVAFDYDDERFTWQTLQDGKVTLLYYGSNRSQAERLLGYATKSLASLQDELGVTLDKGVRIYDYQSKTDMSLALSRRSEAFDSRILTLGVAVDQTTLLILGSHSDVEGTMSHELSHIVAGLATDNPYGGLPRWLDEGLAMYSEGQMPDGNAIALRSAIGSDRLISVRSLSGYANDPEQVDLFYGEVYSLVEFMLKAYGKEKISALLGAFRQGLAQDQALQQTYGFGAVELDRQWRASLGLGPRGTPVFGATPVPPGSSPTRDAPCPWLPAGALLGLAALALRRGRAGAA